MDQGIGKRSGGSADRSDRPGLKTLSIIFNFERNHWVIVDLVGKGGHIRTAPVQDWVKQLIDEWLAAKLDQFKLKALRVS